MSATNQSTRPPGRPPKARNLNGSSDTSDARWTIRGVPKNIREIAVKMAEKRGMTTGDWLCEAVHFYAKSAKETDTSDATLPSDSLPAIIQPVDVSQIIDARLTIFQQSMEEKMTELFRQTQEKPRRWWWPWARKVA